MISSLFTSKRSAAVSCSLEMFIFLALKPFLQTRLTSPVSKLTCISLFGSSFSFLQPTTNFSIFITAYWISYSMLWQPGLQVRLAIRGKISSLYVLLSMQFPLLRLILCTKPAKPFLFSSELIARLNVTSSTNTYTYIAKQCMEIKLGSNFTNRNSFPLF